MSCRITLEVFIKRSNLKHNSFYIYDKTLFDKVTDRGIITCPIHGDFKQKIFSHMYGSGCMKCYNKRRREDNYLKFSQEVFIEKCNKKHNRFYDYSKTIYESIHKKITIICPEHGPFEQIANDHLRGRGCQIHAGLKRHTLDSIVKTFQKVYGVDRYDYSLIKEYKNNKTCVPIRCMIHDYVFWMKANDHLNYHGCHRCNSSRGENKIRDLLQSNNVIFDTQKRFSDCINPHTDYELPFDFAILNKDNSIISLIEYDGEFHFIPILFENGYKINLEKAKENLQSQLYRDNIKNEYCSKNNIRLLRIKYTDFDKIEDILKKEKIIGERING